MHSPFLRAIVDELEASDELTSSALSAALRRSVNIDDVAPWIRFDPNNHVRNLITRTDSAGAAAPLVPGTSHARV